MIPYFALLLIPALFSLFAIHIRRKGPLTVAVSISKDKERAALPAFFSILLLLLILRHETVGRDLPNYQYMFLNYTQWGADYIFAIWQEVFFRTFNWAVMQLTGSFRVFLILTSAISLLPIAYIYNQDKTHGLLKIAVFVNMSTFIMLFSGVRQAMAMGVGMIAYQMVKKGDAARFLFWATVSMLIHHSGIMVFFMYPLYYLRFQKAHLLAVVPAMLAIFIFNKQIFGFLGAILESTYEKYTASVTSTGAFGSLILFVVFSIFAYTVTDDTRCDRETIGLRNFLLFAVAMQCFAPLHHLAMRMNYYYILFIPLALGKCLNYPKKSMRQVAKAGEIVMTVFFAAYFLFGIYQDYTSGISALDTVPYIPFWKNP